MKALAQNTLIQNRYLVVHLIGKGGMGEVYLSVDQRLGSAVALKRTYFAGDEMLGNAFEREARTLARMRHPVLPKVSDHFGEGDEQYLVMEHIAGEDLSKRLEAAQKPFPVSWVMFWADQLLDALSYLHSHEPPIVHRDIKPQNLKLTDDNHIILLDFGLSKTSTGQTHLSSTGSTGSVVGYTPHYAPMEQIRGIGTDARSDLYSLSATLYQMLTNVVPDDALSRADALLNGLPDPIVAPHAINPEVPAAVSEVLLKGMEVSQERRYGTAREMQKELRRAFTRMQEAMAAQTVAFNLGDVAEIENQPSSAVENTHIMPSGPRQPVAAESEAAVGADGSQIDFDATLAFDPVDDLERARQPETSIEMPAPIAEGNGQNDSFFPPIHIDPSETDKDDRDSFVTVIASSAASLEQEPAPISPRVATTSAKKPRSKAVAVFGGLAALLVLAIGTAGAGWYYYTNYYAAAVIAEPSPSPGPSPEMQTSLPALPTETAPESNSIADSNTTQDTDVNTNVTSGETNSTAVPVSRPGSVNSASRPTLGVTRPAANRAPALPGTKATPRPKTNPGRTDILQ
ncbi:MAG: serine/threonine protein kinase [Blastocatellia bacterium]|nr:serine/threonine protein kinase [Blastocatellia bacterium]